MEGRSESMQEGLVLELARAIHSEYNRHRLLDSPDCPLEYPDWDALPEDIRNSNIRQARSIPVKLSLIGCHIGYEGAVEVESFSRDEVEVMAKREHELWVEEREAAGWTLGPKNVELKTSPDLIPWDELEDYKREYDREAVVQIIDLARSIGMRVFRDEDA